MQQAKKMKLRLYLALAAMLLPSLMFAAQKNVPLYVCGLATSFNDSTVYFTEIQKIDSAYVDSKTGFLYGRDSYSYQLREQMQKQGLSQGQEGHRQEICGFQETLCHKGTLQCEISHNG